MRILYTAIDQRVPGTTGGSVHVAQVASGLAALGHDVHALVTPGNQSIQDREPLESELRRFKQAVQQGNFPHVRSVQWHSMRPPLGWRQLRWMRVQRITELTRALRADVVIERYYNFGGEGVTAASRTGALAVLEVNTPIIDHSGSLKRWIDRGLFFEPLRRWREWQCRQTDLFVTPSTKILPQWIESRRVLRLEWGADTARFTPDAHGDVPFRREPGETVVIFAGAFRPWHGAIHLVRAIAKLRARGRPDIKAVFVGDGPELRRVRRAASGVGNIVFVGRLSHWRMPACLAAADIGVAPFDVEAHGPLRLDFYWSPLKVFEYMAAGLPVIVPNVQRLRALCRDGREGVTYDAAEADDLANAIERLADAPHRDDLGRAARERAVKEYGWDVHCRRLSEALERAREQMEAKEH